MALFNHLFPYSNLHDINLDWIISIIKSIDPAVIQALQELTPDIIEQVNQKVSEAQAAAIAAQSSASEANTARENATVSAAEAAQDATDASTNATAANADAVRAENAANNAANVVNAALAPQIISPTFADFLTISSGLSWVSGKIMHISAYGRINSVPGSPEYPTIVTFPPDKKIIAGQTGSFFVKTGNVVSDMIACGSTAEKVDINRGTLVQDALFLLTCDFVLQ